MVSNSRKFPLKTVLVIIKAQQLGRRGIKTGVTEQDGKELLRHMYPNLPVPNPLDLGHYLRNGFARRLRKAFPHLAHVSVAKVTSSCFDEWMGVQESEFGALIDVPISNESR